MPHLDPQVRHSGPVTEGDGDQVDDDPWWQIAVDVADGIRSGRISIGSKLDIPEDVAGRYGVHLNTARKAYGHLRDLGIVATSTRGTFAASTPPDPLPRPIRVSPLERRINARIDELARRVERLERERPPTE